MSRFERHPSARWRMAALAVAVALVSGACKSEAPELRIGLQRIALDLAFRAEGEEKPEAVQALAATIVPSQAQFAVSVPPDTLQSPRVPVRPLAPPCAVAAGALPEKPVTNTVLTPPALGLYRLHRTGTFAIESAVFPFKGPMPATGDLEYRKLKVIPGTSDVLGNKAADQFEWEVYEKVGDNFTARTMRATPTAIQLVRQVTKVGTTTVTFNPTPPVTLVGLGTGPGASWNSASVDTATGTSMVVQGRVVKRENVDLCGKVYDTFMVQSTERITNVGDQYTSQTTDAANQASGAAGGDAGKPNYYWVATQYGGLFIQEEFHTTTTMTTQVGGARVPITLKLDYRNTFDSIDPAGPVSAS